MTTIREATPQTASDPTADGKAFEDLLKNVRVLARTDRPDDYRQATVNDQAPSMEQYEELEEPGKSAADTVRYTTRDGEKVIVYRSSTPELYQRVAQDYYTRDAIEGGYTLSVDNGDSLSYYEHITGIDTSHASEGVITYTFGANKFVITKGNTPDTFDRLLHMEQVLGYRDNGYALLGAEENPSMSSENYKDIVFTDDGVALVTTQDDKRLVISSQLNAEAYQQLHYVSDVMDQVHAGEQNGYSLVDTLPADLDMDKLKVESIDDKTGLIRFEYDGKKYMLPPGDAAEAEIEPPEGVRIGLAGANAKSPIIDLRGTRLYELLSALKQTEGSVAHDALVNAMKNGDALARDNKTPASLDEIDNIHSYSEGGVQVVTLKNGETITVIEAMAPQAFQVYAESAKVLDGIARAGADGYRLAGADEYLPDTEDIGALGAVGEYGPGLITFTYRKPGGEEEKIIVSESLNPEMFAQVSGHRDDISLQINDLDALRKEHGLPPLAEVSLNELETTEKNDDGQALTVQELAMKRQIDEYRAGVENGSISADDPRAKFLRALEAKSMAENGMQIIPEHGRGYKADASDPITVTSRDVREEIFDVRAIDETLAELAGDETVKADLERFDKEAREKVVGGPEKVAEAEQKLKDSANSQAFREYIKALEESGKTELAQLEIQQTYLSLAQVDPQQADQFLGDLSRDTMIMDLDAILADPSQVSQDNSALAAIDTTNYWLRAARAIPDIPTHLISSWETTVQKFMNNKTDAAAFSKVYAELGDTYMRNGVITDADIQKALEAEKNAFQSLSSTEKDNLTKMFTTMKDTGTLGSVSGLFGLARGIYQLHGNPGGLASTSEGRLAIASDFITFASFSNNFMTLGSKTYDTLFKTKVYENLGLTKTIPDMWRNPPGTPPNVEIETDLSKHLAGQGFLPDKPDVYIPDGKGGFRVEPGGPNSGGSWITDEKGGNATRGGTGNPSAYPNYDPEAFKQGYLGGNGNTKYRIADASTGHRIAGSVSRFIGSSADLVGAVTGVVLGAFGIRDGLKNGDPLQTASGFIGVFGGLSGVVAGAASVNGAWGIIGGTAGRVIGALGPVGFLLSAGLGFLGAILGTIKTNKLHKVSLQNWDQIKQFEKDGLLKEGGAGNYVWLQTYLSNYRQRDAPENQSIFDFRNDEWHDGGTKHYDYIGDGPNETSEQYKYATGETTFINDEKEQRQYTTYGYGEYVPADEPWPPAE